MEITIKGTPEEIERILRKLSPRERRQIQVPYIGPQVHDPIQTPFIPYPPQPWGTVTGGLTLGDGVAPLTVGYSTQH